MKFITAFPRCFGFALLSVLSALPFDAALANSVTDHRVQNLSCQNISADTVARALRPIAFAKANHLPYVNWSFSATFYDLGACWSLARFQRLYFYLREPGAQTNLIHFSNQARDADMYDIDEGWRTFPMRQFWFMPDQADARWRSWERGWNEAPVRAPSALPRGLIPDIEFYQETRFHQIKNLRLLRGPLARTPRENVATWNTIKRLVASGRKPLVVLRQDRYLQHVVLVKSVRSLVGGAELRVYDSNHPDEDRTFRWHEAEAMFTSDADVRVREPFGVFVVDEKENEILLQALAGHYRQQCQARALSRR